MDTGALEAEFLARLALPSVSASHDAIDTIADLPAAVARYLAAQGEPHTLCLPRDPQRLQRIFEQGIVPHHPWQVPVVQVEEIELLLADA